MSWGRGSLGNPGPSWHVMGTGDYNGAGQDDIQFQNTNSAVAAWQVSGTHIIISASRANPGPTWHV
jgi:serralysin